MIEPEDNPALGACETCGEPVHDEDQSGDAKSCGLVMHIACVGSPHPYEQPLGPM
jgi:hypothetical protein